MSGSSSSNSRTCPICGSPNSSISLFCAECGSSLNASSSERNTPSDDSQTTTIFKPISNSSQREPVSTVSPMPRYDEPAASTWQAPIPATSTSAMVVVPAASTRGFYLGVVASLLILLVFLLWVWAAVLDASTRDNITSLFGLLD